MCVCVNNGIHERASARVFVQAMMDAQQALNAQLATASAALEVPQCPRERVAEWRRRARATQMRVREEADLRRRFDKAIANAAEVRCSCLRWAGSVSHAGAPALCPSQQSSACDALRGELAKHKEVRRTVSRGLGWVGLATWMRAGARAL